MRVLRALAGAVSLYLLGAAMPVPGLVMATEVPALRCSLQVVSTAPLQAVGRCWGWQPGQVFQSEIRIDGPGGRQHWSPRPGWGPAPLWDLRHFTGPEVAVRTPGRYRLALLMDGTEVAHTWVEIN